MADQKLNNARWANIHKAQDDIKTWTEAEKVEIFPERVPMVDPQLTEQARQFVVKVTDEKRYFDFPDDGSVLLDLMASFATQHAAKVLADREREIAGEIRSILTESVGYDQMGDYLLALSDRLDGLEHQGERPEGEV